MVARILGLILIVVCGCGTPDKADSEDPNESFLVGDVGGKQDAILIQEGSPEALGVLAVVNELDRTEHVSEVGLDPRAAEAIEVYRLGAPGTSDDRELQTLDELDAIPWVGMTAFIALYEYAEREGYVDRFRVVVTCTQHTDCGADAVCWFGHCADETRTVHALPSGHVVAPSPQIVHTGPRAGEWRLRTRHLNSSGEIVGRGAHVDQATYELNLAGRFWPVMTRLHDWFVDLDIYDDRLVPHGEPELALPAGWQFAARVVSENGGDYILLDQLVLNSAVEYRIYELGATGWNLDFEITVPAVSSFAAEVALGVDIDGHPLLFVEESGLIVQHRRTAGGAWQRAPLIDLAHERFAQLHAVKYAGNADGRNYIYLSSYGPDLAAVFEVIQGDVVRYDLSFVAHALTPTSTGLLAWSSYHQKVARIGARGVSVTETPFVQYAQWIDVDHEGNLTRWRWSVTDWELEIRHLQLR